MLRKNTTSFSLQSADHPYYSSAVKSLEQSTAVWALEDPARPRKDRAWLPIIASTDD